MGICPAPHFLALIVSFRTPSAVLFGLCRPLEWGTREWGSGCVGSLFFESRRGVGAAAPIQMRLRGYVYVNAPGGEGDES